MSLESIIESTYRICSGSKTDLEIFHVRLTDSALKNIENLYRKQTKPIKLSVEGDHGTLAVPSKQSYDYFDLSISPVHYSPEGIIDYVQIQGSNVSSLGKPVSRLTVKANDDSFSAAKIKMAEAEKEQRRCQSKTTLFPDSSKSLTPRRYQETSSGQRPTQTPPNSRLSEPRISPSLNANRCCSPHCANKSPLTPTADVASRRLRDRIIHLLALRPYKRPELLLRLKQDGLTNEDKELVDDILNKVGRPGRQGDFSLAATFYNLIETSWPGYSQSERATITSIKAKLQSSSPTNRLLPENASRGVASRQNSPSTIIAADDFGRKPTRASAPSAPHSLGKKIAALDLLSSGIPVTTVASQHGITVHLLEQWKSSEAVLRQRYAQRQGSTSSVPATTIPQPSRSSFADIPERSPHLRRTLLPSAPTQETECNTPNRTVTKEISGSTSVPKRRLGDSISDTNELIPDVTSNKQRKLTDIERDFTLTCSGSSNSTASTRPIKISRKLPQKPASPVLNDIGYSRPAESTEQGFENKRTSPTYVKHPTSAELRPVPPPSANAASLPFCEQVNGSSGDSAYYTSNGIAGGFSSSGSSINGSAGGLCARSSIEDAHTNSRVSRRRPPMGCGSEAGSCGDSNVPSPQTPPTQDTQPPGKSMLSVFQPSHCADEKSSELSDEECLYSDIASETAELERLFPEIRDSTEASAYRNEFESLYPTYLHLYQSFQAAWETIETLKMRVLTALRERSSSAASQSACELDEFIKGMRTPQRRADEIQLAVMTYKLRLLKQRLAVFTAQGVESKMSTASVTGYYKAVDAR
ncbi:hypothetical protein AAHC03_01283 [Spirometra sp. Aus1]